MEALLLLLVLPLIFCDNSSEFRFMWNVPTFMCHQYGLNFAEVSNKWGMVQNNDDQFRGNQIALLYTPGLWPEITSTGEKVNGGVPQEGNITAHLDAVRQYVEENMTDAEFSGLGVIDFELWRPILRQNWNALTVYKNESINIEKELHPDWTDEQIQEEATKRFESAAQEFMEKTIELFISLRPKAKWGYYGFPPCANTYQDHCPSEMVDENDRLQWLYNASTALYPSLYESGKYSLSQHTDFLKGRMNEATRVATNTNKTMPVYAYFRYNFYDTGCNLPDEDLYYGFQTIKDQGANGVIIWGSSNDLNNQTKCKDFNEFLNTHLGPIAAGECGPQCNSISSAIMQKSNLMNFMIIPIYRQFS